MDWPTTLPAIGAQWLRESAEQVKDLVGYRASRVPHWWEVLAASDNAGCCLLDL